MSNEFNDELEYDDIYEDTFEEEQDSGYSYNYDENDYDFEDSDEEEDSYDSW
ncbi:hypothetical protein KDE13_06965 [Campylobacter sp. faydin G-140]|uniref:hypothetical protein n=1 Tax=Campylobacter anatolicus TaxID=2829105 RepID=UPI001BA419AB|nr:hypothetical protein [Campylobacter anatolicus]MBR8466082.1 hypothetical protein [Campylobacter anatolicus]